MTSSAPASAVAEPRICTRCVLDTTVPALRFDERGECHYCRIHDSLEAQFPLDDGAPQRLNELVERIKRDGRGRPYDIIIGVSGGRDSTYALYMAVKLGLRPLAVHFDNGWNSETAVTNIKHATEILKVDLHTYVVDWDEFKDLQVAFLKASVSDAEIPTDVAIHGILHKVAAEEGVKYLVFAHSFRTEGIAPLGWTYMDGRYITSVQRRFGTRPLKSYPNLTLRDVFYYKAVCRIKVVPLLVYMTYHQKEVDALLQKELGWTYYGGHHHESYYTHFFQSYYLPRKFGIDKRKIEYSALIRSGQMTRAEALREIRDTPYPYDEDLVTYTLSKLDLSREAFEAILRAPNKSFHDYPTYYPWIRALRLPLLAAARMKWIPQHLYYKFLG